MSNKDEGIKHHPKNHDLHVGDIWRSRRDFQETYNDVRGYAYFRKVRNNDQKSS
jgi:hypothetical protein